MRFVDKHMNILVPLRLLKFVEFYQHTGYWDSLNNIATTPASAPRASDLHTSVT